MNFIYNGNLSSEINVLYGNYVKYDRLYYLTKHLFGDGRIRELNIYLDMNSLTKILYRYANIEINDGSLLPSLIINLAIHLREYYRSRHGCYTNIYIVYGDNFPVQPRELVPEYNQKHYQKYITNKITSIINNGISMLDTICPYLDGIYMVHLDSIETSVIMASLIENNNSLKDIDHKIVPNIIFTKDPLVYQLVAYCQRTFIIRPRKINNDDSSWIVTKKNLYSTYDIEMGRTPMESYERMPIDLFSLMVSLEGAPYRDIKSLISHRPLIGKLIDSIEACRLPKTYSMDILPMILEIGGYIKGDSIDDLLLSRYRALDLRTNLLGFQNSPSVISLQKALINLEDPETLKQINEQYFLNIPLDLNRL